MAFNSRIGFSLVSIYSKVNFQLPLHSQVSSGFLNSNTPLVVLTRNFGRKVKRRINHPFRWWTKRRADSFKGSLSKENQEFVDEYVKEKFATTSPLKQEQMEKKEWTPESKRVGLIARKIGVHPMWLKDGRRILTTLLQVNDNHIIKCYTSDEFKENAIYQERWRYHKMGCAIVGAESDHPLKYSAQYSGLFVNAGLPPKKKIAKMIISDDAILPPGTPLYATHFRVGDWVDVYGKTIDHGFQGVMKRWDFAGGPAGRNTKFDRRPGSISRGRKACGPLKGKKMPGHMGCERKTLPGVQIMRINTKLNIIYVRGPAVPGELGNWVYIFDTFIKEKQLNEKSIVPPFPTFFPEEEKEPLAEDIYHPNVHPMDEKTIVFVETEEEKKAVRTGAKLAKVRTKK